MSQLLTRELSWRWSPHLCFLALRTEPKHQINLKRYFQIIFYSFFFSFFLYESFSLYIHTHTHTHTLTFTLIITHIHVHVRTPGADPQWWRHWTRPVQILRILHKGISSSFSSFLPSFLLFLLTCSFLFFPIFYISFTIFFFRFRYPLFAHTTSNYQQPPELSYA